MVAKYVTRPYDRDILWDMISLSNQQSIDPWVEWRCFLFCGVLTIEIKLAANTEQLKIWVDHLLFK